MKTSTNIKLHLQDSHVVNLSQPSIILPVENGWLVIDNNEGLVRHNSYENKGLSAFSRTVAMSSFSHVSVVTRHQGGTRSDTTLPDKAQFIPVIVTKYGHLLPITCPWDSFSGAHKAALAFGQLCYLHCREMEKSVIAIRHEATPLRLARFSPGKVFKGLRNKAAFLLLTLAGVVTHSLVGILCRLACF